MTVLLGALVVALLTAAWVVHPLVFRKWGILGDVVEGDVLEREARKRVALAALKDVEYDNAAGKLDQADYRDLRSRLEMEAMDAVKAVEGDEPRHGPIRGLHSCGFENPGGSRFCSGCGQPLT